MGLVDLTTNLRSLRYGKDTVGGGNSNQPYVQTKIPDSFSKIGKTGGPDFLLRGGTLLPKIVVNDVSRLAQMFFDFKSPTGPLFIAKQNVLSLTNVNSEVGYVNTAKTTTTATNNTLGAIGQFIKDNVPLNQGAYTPLSTLAQAVGNPIGIHVNKQGLNPFKFKTTQGSPNGNGPLGLPTYLNTIYTNGTDGSKSRLWGFLDKVNKNQQNNDLYSYSGGPGAILGVGKTNIVMLGDQRTGINNINTTREQPKVTWGSATRFSSFANPFNINNFGSNPLSSTNQIGSGGSTSYTRGDINISPTVNDDNLSNAITNDQFLRVGASAAYLGNNFILQNANTSIKSAFLGNGRVKTFSVYEQNNDPFSLVTKNDGEVFNSGILNGPPRLQLTQEQISIKTPVSKGGKIENFSEPFVGPYVPTSLNYTTKNIETRVNLGDPGRRGNRSSYSIGFRDGTNTLATENNIESIKANSGYNYALDKINALPLYQSDSVTLNNIKNDLVKFRIGVLNNKNPNLKTYIHFRAHIDSMSDNFSADWQSQKYMGRGENFYKYQGFDRSLSLSWTVAAQSKQELIPMYQKLNYLASITAPSYSSEGYMGGNLISLTIGGYLHEQIGIIKGLTLDVPTESPWEISIPDNNTIQVVPGSEDNPDREIFTDPSVKELPMIIKVTGFNFIPIHNFVPKVQDNDFAGGKTLEGGGTFVGSYGPEHYINLLAASGNNYDGQGNNLNYIPPIPKEVFANTLANISRLKLF
jgi:hypothetical protein